MVKSKKAIKPQKLLKEFALMCQKSKIVDNDWQGDGWGIAYQQQSLKDTSEVTELAPPRWRKKDKDWVVNKSLKPIWEEQEKFLGFPKTNMFIVHARSASFPNQKGIIEYNQPFIKGNYCFVFNGILKGVKLEQKTKGKIGSQKIFNLLLDFAKNYSPKESLEKIKYLFIKNSKLIVGLNIGLTYKNNFYVLCQYNNNEDYFAIRYNNNKDLTIISSEKFGNYKFKKMSKGQIKVF